MVGAGLVAVIVLLALGAPWITPVPFDRASFGEAWQFPSEAHWFGTDGVGRDFYTRVVYGSRISLVVGITAQAMALAAGLPLGLAAGTVGGRIDFVVMRVVDALIAVPQLFAMAIDRDALVKSVWRGMAVPAFGMLPPGFHCAQPARLKDAYAYNPEQARKLLADAGFPDGKGFPKYDLHLRAASPTVKTAGEAIQAMIKQNLGIELGVQNLERKLFMDRLNKYDLPIVLIPWEYDYYDASNYMNIYKTGGRHPWTNVEYDKLVAEANSGASDASRCAVYRKAEDILVREPAAVFLWHPTVTRLWKPWVKGEILKKNKFGIVGWQRPSKGDMTPYIYIGKEKP
jgi:ABC-type transport system substrate-binding protein